MILTFFHVCLNIAMQHRCLIAPTMYADNAECRPTLTTKQCLVDLLIILQRVLARCFACIMFVFRGPAKAILFYQGEICFFIQSHIWKLKAREIHDHSKQFDCCL